MQKAGWSREDVQNYVFEHTKMAQAEMQRANIRPGPITPETENTMQTLVHTPQDLLVIAAGGKAGVQSCYIPGWGGKNGSQSVTYEIKKP
jgi:phospholipase/lecithinase/hemolysin